LLAKDGGETPVKTVRKSRKSTEEKEPKAARVKAVAADAAEKPARRVVNRQKKLKVAA
jgi:hypothetical protein